MTLQLFLTKGGPLHRRNASNFKAEVNVTDR